MNHIETFYFSNFGRLGTRVYGQRVVTHGKNFNMEDRFMRLTLGKVGWGVVGTLLLITPLWASGPRAEAGPENVKAYNWAYAEEASELLEEIRGLSSQLAEDSDYLEHHARRNQLNWRSHAERLNQIRGDINAMGGHLQRLQEIHGMIAPWQQKAVDRITPKAAELAAHTEAAIAQINDNRSKTWTSSFVDPVSAMADQAEAILNDVKMFLEYGKTSDQLKGLEGQMEITGA